MNIYTKNKITSHNEGAIALPTVLVLASVLLAIGLAINMTSFNKIETISNNENALGAFYIAEAGIKDAVEKVSRVKDYNTNYVLPIKNGSADIVFDDFPPPGQITIISTGTLDNNIKKIQASFAVDTDGKLTQISWQEVY